MHSVFYGKSGVTMIHKAQENGLIKGLVANYIDQGLVVLQYADDTILCIEDDLESV
jgi:hypothetical protein